MKREISPDFTIEDIHKIREDISEAALGLSLEEQIAYYNGLGQGAEAEIERRRLAAGHGAAEPGAMARPVFA